MNYGRPFCERREMPTQFLLEHLKGRDLLGDLGVSEKIILKCILQKWDVKM